MTLSAGSRLGPYEILAPIGAGGMGEVYRAKDPRLSREVAIKVLPASFSADPDRLRRFEQEAKAAGVLNHPNITAVYDIGSHDGAPYVVQELLEGETLRAVLAGGKLSPRKAIDHALQIAHGLAAAHDKGIVHRDLKPENLFVTNEGRVKILDFGLAKLTQLGDGSGPQTNLPTAAGTEPGMVMGTLGYMSPEQIKGKPADARSDIFSFGAILYEMLSGKRAFHADSAGETMAAILKEDPPDLSSTNQSVSPGFERIVRHCLEKNPEQRFHSAHDLAFDIEALSGASGQATVMPARKRPRLMPALLIAIGALAGVVLAYVALRGGRGGGGAAGAGPTFRRLTNLSGAENSPTLSPDGQTLAFVHRSGDRAHVWMQRVTGHKPIDLTPDCQRPSYSPAFSPDGSLIAYGSQCGEGGLFIMGATGENVRRITSFGAEPAWSPDGRQLVFSTEPVDKPYGRMGTSELWRVEVGGGEPRKVFAEDAIQPSVSPHALRIAYWALPTGGSQRDIWTIPYKGLAPGEKAVPVTQDAAVDWNPVWSPDGKALFYLSNRDGAMNLWRVPIDENSGKPLGPPQPDRLPAREVGGFAISKDGQSIVYVDREMTYAIDRLTFDAEGRLAGKPEQVYESSQEVTELDLSPDGKSFTFDSRGGAQDDIFVVGADGTGLRQLTDDAYRDRHPVFSPDGKHLAFHSDRSGHYDIWTIAADGSGLKQLTKTTGDTTIEPLWSPDGKRLAANSGREAFFVMLDEKGAAGPMQKIPPPGPGTAAYPWRGPPTAGGCSSPSCGCRIERRSAWPSTLRRRTPSPSPSTASRRPGMRGEAPSSAAASFSPTSTACTSPTLPTAPIGWCCRRHRSGASARSSAATRRPATSSGRATTPTSGSARRAGRPNDAVLRQDGLTDAYITAILMHMRTTLILDDELLERARSLTGLKEKTAMVHAGLEALIARESARRLATLGGSEKGLRRAPRRRTQRAPGRRRS